MTEPATYKQVKTLQQYNVPGAENFSKQDATAKIGELFEAANVETAKPGEFVKPKIQYPTHRSDDSKKTMYVSYAKDIFIAALDDSQTKDMPVEEVMDMSIKLVKQAKEAF
jgi:hypothetical protein